jgi:SAM-dependent methyltransferase
VLAPANGGPQFWWREGVVAGTVRACRAVDGNIRGVIEDGSRWDARYEGREMGQPAPPKGLDGIELTPPGRCLDVACGLGEQSVWAARRGFDVIALDVSPAAIKALRAGAREHGLADYIDARLVDLDEGLPDDVTGSCALVICQRFRDVRLYPQLAAAASSGGVIVITVLSQVGATQPGPFHAPPGELVKAFSSLDVDIERSIEADGEATLVARRRHAERSR